MTSKLQISLVTLQTSALAEAFPLVRNLSHMEIRRKEFDNKMM